MEILVDSNVLLDILTEDPTWYEWSAHTLERFLEDHRVCINPVIYAEVSIGFERIEDLDASLSQAEIGRLRIPYEAAFLAGKSYLLYRQRGGNRRSPLPDFFIGAHAAVAGMPLITRDVGRYRTYFPRLALICPESNNKSI